MYERREKIVRADGRKISIGSRSQTTRTLERHQEDLEYLPVIIKRSDESVRHTDDTFERAKEAGIIQYERPNISLFLSAISAGLIIGFAGMCVALMSQLISGGEHFFANRIAVALVYPFGFIVCIMSGTQLFTEQTATALYPVLEGRIKVRYLLMLWLIVLFGNLVGTIGSSVILYLSDVVIMAGDGYIKVANHLTHYTFFEILVSAILAGWLMAQGGWLIHSTPSGSSQILSIFIVTFIIGFGGLHHSIAGSGEVFSGLFHAIVPDYLAALKFLVSSVLGNLLGGTLFVGALNYAHIRKTQ